MARTRSARTIYKTARQRFGFDALRPGQRDAIEAVLAGRDALAVLPTGAGKSAIYQIAGALLDGPTVVVSPLIALQRDQEEAIAAQDSGGGLRLNSSLSAGNRDAALAAFAAGDTEFLLLAPEQFAHAHTLDRLAAADPTLFVVDEAHCISDWGHDVRPDYLRLAAVADALGDPVRLALTATAAPPVRDEIVARLRLDDPAVIVKGFDRPNIHLAVERFTDHGDKLDALLAFVERSPRPGIVYAATRKHAESVAVALTDRGLAARPYHAGLAAGIRDEVQTAFMGGDLPVVVATTAFGMGIDKSDIRFVAHFDVSESLDAYYQEIGRAGRDGEPAVARLFFVADDIGVRRFFAASGTLDEDDVRWVADAVHATAAAVDPDGLAADLGLSSGKVAVALARLEEAGAVALHADGSAEPVGGDGHAADGDLDEAASKAVEAQERRRRHARTRVEMMRAYADADGCRRGFLLGYFGESFGPPCGNCDACDAGHGRAEGSENNVFPVGSDVVHATWGHGSVVRNEAETVTVLFEAAGYRTLARDLATAEGLLREACEASV